MSNSEDSTMDSIANETISKENEILNGNEKSKMEDSRHKEDESDPDALEDSLSSQGETQTLKDEKLNRASRVPKKLPRKISSDNSTSTARMSTERQEAKKILHFKTSENTSKKSQINSRGDLEEAAKDLDKKFSSTKAPSELSSESSEDKTLEEVKEIDASHEIPNVQRIGTDDEIDKLEENGLREDGVHPDQKIEEMGIRIEKLEEELRQIAALEISLYSVVPEHGSSAHKVHTPARRLSRLYIHACKHWTQDKRASIAKNIVSGLVLIAKSCGNDVPRLTYWWSNIVVLREIIAQIFGNSHHSSLSEKTIESNGNGRRRNDEKSSVKSNGAGSKEFKKLDFMQFVHDWQEAITLIAALEKIESWIFSRAVESVWWQILTPHMQSPIEESYAFKSSWRQTEPQEGNFSIDLWNNAFKDAFLRLCPVRAGRHECGCLPVLARMVMEQCVARLDVAMFNAILRESANEMPTDPVSDPIVDSSVLPILAGNLSFGSGAQLKNSIGNWSRCLTDLFGMDADDFQEEISGEDTCLKDLDSESKSFHLLNALSDLLMLPKDMLMDKTIRKEVCPSLGLPLIKRVLCNFTPDEFCPDPVPGTVLEALNSESPLEQWHSNEELISYFPCSAAPIVYSPPSQVDVAEKVADTAGGQIPLGRNASIVQRRGYTSDEELDELECPLTCIIDKMPPSPASENERTECFSGGSVRFELLREVWSS